VGGIGDGKQAATLLPWGTVLAQAPDGDGVIVADLDMAALADIRERLPALRHRRPEAYGLEEEHLAADRLETGA
jgi:predicted amidohydrolase